MSSLPKSDQISSVCSSKITSTSLKKDDDCLICKIIEISEQDSKIVDWIVSSNKTLIEKANLASLLTGIDFNPELIDCLQDPEVKQFIFSR
ncbi:MAG: hypothetical protein ACFFDW_06850 [Candidatus Thorarchaeota archaeon]